jgi:hypothetical protein
MLVANQTTSSAFQVVVFTEPGRVEPSRFNFVDLACSEATLDREGTVVICGEFSSARSRSSASDRSRSDTS